MAQRHLSQGKEIRPNPVLFLLVTVAAVTLVFKIDFYDPFNSAKLILLLILNGWLIGHLINSYRARLLRIYTLEFIVSVVLAIFISSLLLSTFLTDSFIVGLIGETQRRNGFLSYLSLVIVLLYTSRSITLSNIDKVYKTGILVGVALSTYGVIQISGRDFIAWENPNNSMISTLGNPNFASALLAVLILIGIYSIMLKSITRPFKVLSAYVLVAGLFAIVVSDSRQGLMVVFFSLIFYISVYSYLRNKLLGIFLGLASIISGVVVILGMLQIGPLAALVYKDSVSVRGYYWRAGIEMFKDSPMTGIGVDRYGAYFKEFREVGYPLKYGYEITSSNAHNTFIQLFSTAGVVVGLSYLVLMALIFFSGVSLVKQYSSENKEIVLGLLSTWIGFQAQSLISIDNIGVSIWGWFLGGSILALKFRMDEKLITSEVNRSKSARTNQVDINLLQPTISILVMIPILIFSSNFYKVEQNLFILKGISNPAFPENKQAVLQYVNKTLESPLVDPFYEYRLSIFLFDMGYTDESYKVLAELLARDPKNPDFLRGKVFIEESRNNIAGVISARERIAKIDPWNADNYLQLVKLYKANNNLPLARIAQSKILDFAPESEFAKTATEILNEAQ
jgi:O-antigen ligase